MKSAKLLKPAISNFSKCDPAISNSCYLEYPAISNFLLGLMKVRDSGTPLYDVTLLSLSLSTLRSLYFTLSRPDEIFQLVR